MIPTATSDTFTISIPRTAAGHLLLGIALATGAIAAFITYASIPTGYPIRGIALGAGVIGACGALTYWIWCTLQCIKATSKASHEATRNAIAALIAEQRERDKRAASRETMLLEALEDVHRDHKKLTDAIDALTKAFGILRDCYLEEGRVQDETQHTAPPQEFP